ncbi:hypothetical protein AAMO2058_000765300 [Amorphochlora amoebiformis]
MATRNLTKRYNTIRSSYGRRHLRSIANDSDSSRISQDPFTVVPGAPSSLPPAYIDLVDMIESDEYAVQDSIKKLKHLHAQRLKVSFIESDEHAQDAEIHMLANQIQTLLGRSESNLKKIAMVGNNGRISTEDRICRLNIMRGYARRLQQTSRSFKTAQRNFILSLKGQADFGKNLIAEEDEAKVLAGFSYDEEKVQMMERESQAQEKEIDELVESISAISSLFKELSVLVIDQGTMLDRIDYNVESVAVKARDATKQMEKAYDYSKNTRSWYCILILTLIMILQLLLIYLKYS